LPNLEIDNSRHLYYQLIQGDRDKPHLVFLHEGLGCSTMWKGFPGQLCKATGCPGLVYDRLGYGKSAQLNHTRSIHYLHEYALIELPELLKTVIPHTPFILIGHSDGGSISLIYGAERPALLKGIITEAAHVFVEPETIAGIKVADKAWAKGLLQGLSKYHGDKTEAIFKAWSVTWLSSEFKSWNIEYLLPGITAPLLVIQGADDHYGTMAQVSAIASQSSGDARQEVIEDCGHAPHLEARAVVLGLMAGFVTRINTNGLVKSPTPALRCISQSFNVR
jgi:pimeloyl-ACP methyl ester carboxylesterase